jgi:ATP-dependent Clp endopeptidase proteolytic subunit ClpP
MVEEQDNLLLQTKKIYGIHNHIYFYDVVNTDSCCQLISLLKSTIKNCKKMVIDYDLVDNMKIYLHINSMGGAIYDAMTIIDTIETSDIPIVSIIEGVAASAATLISVVCDERHITKNSYMLIHQLSSGIWGNMFEIETEVKNLKKLMTMIQELYTKNTLVDVGSLKRILKKDIYWNSSECLELGLVDKIIETKKRKRDITKEDRRKISKKENKEGILNIEKKLIK